MPALLSSTPRALVLLVCACALVLPSVVRGAKGAIAVPSALRGEDGSNGDVALALPSALRGGHGAKGGHAAVAPQVRRGTRKTPLMGWNTWCVGSQCGGDVCTEDEIKSVALSLISSGLAELYPLVSLDDCWADTVRDANGDIQPDPTRFPSGMAALGSWLHERGFLFGIYTSLGYTVCNLGNHTTHPVGSYGHEVADAATFARWNVSYLKGDWCDPRGLNMQNQTTVFANAIAVSPNPDMLFMFHCTGQFAPWCPVLGASSRVDPDHFDVWTGGAGHTGLHGTGDTIELLNQEGKLVGLQPSGDVWFADWDLLMIGGQACPNAPNSHCPGQTDDEYRTEFTFWSLASSPLIFATDPRNLTAIMKSVLGNTELIAVNQDPVPRPGMGVVRVLSSPCSPVGAVQCQLWYRAPGSDGSHYVVLFNPNDSGVVAYSFSWADVGLPPAASFSVRDLWLHENLGDFTGSYTTEADIPPHGVRALKLTAV